MATQPKVQQPQPPDQIAPLVARLEALERRLAALEAQQSVTLDDVTAAISEAARRLAFNIEPLTLTRK